MNQNEKTTKKNKSISAIIGFAVFVLVSYGVKQFFKKDVASELKKAAQKVNAQSPMMVDEYTQLDSAAAVGETKLVYYYTLKAIEKSQIEIDTVKKYMKEGIIEDLRVSPEVKAFRDNNITLGYNYYDKNGELIVNIEATPEDYR